MVQSTAHHSFYPISSVLILAEEDGWLAGVGGNVRNYWLAGGGKTTGQGFTLKVDSCPSTVVMDVPEIIGLYNVKSILTDNSI